MARIIVEPGMGAPSTVLVALENEAEKTAAEQAGYAIKRRYGVWVADVATRDASALCDLVTNPNT